MLKQHGHFMLIGLVVADAFAISTAWLASYWLRFELLPVDPAKGVPALWDKFLPMLPLVVAAHLLIFYRIHLYRPRRGERLFSETRDIVKAFLVAVVVVILIDYFMPETNKISRQFVGTYAVVGTTLFALFRFTVRIALRLMRRAGYNRRHAAIIGSGRSAQRLLWALRRQRWTGYEVAYFVDDPRGSGHGGPGIGQQGGEVEKGRLAGSGIAAARAEPDVTGAASDAADGLARVASRSDRAHVANLRGIPVYSPLASLQRIVEQHPVDAVFIALPADQSDRTEAVLDDLGQSLADVRLVPDINPAYTMRPDVGRLEGVPILSLRQSPLYGSNVIVKRAFDLIVGAACLMLAAPAMLVIAALIRLSSPGPVLYRQRRMGLDGREFTMLKFRTMRVDAEAGGAVWSRRTDPRRTRLGGFLRRTSLDELPNLFNVLRGEMSLVGPRPERPEFIAEFRHEIPNYMLRHKMKAGMTGYAQVKGYRGETSLKKRIQHDMHYIRHWSLWLDIRILAQTVLAAWFSRHEAPAVEPAPAQRAQQE
ncbi:MAG: undecaprenyl-phosphate glucose phosphotransferase [Planctomycetota bacterium]